MVGASASDGMAARAASFSEAMALELVKCDAKTLILSLILLFLALIHRTILGETPNPMSFGLNPNGSFLVSKRKSKHV